MSLCVAVGCFWRTRCLTDVPSQRWLGLSRLASLCLGRPFAPSLPWSCALPFHTASCLSHAGTRHVNSLCNRFDLATRAARTYDFVARSIATSSAVVSFCFDPLLREGRQQLVAACYLPNELLVYDLGSGAVRPLPGHAATVYDARFTCNGRSLVSSGEGGNVLAWSPDTW